MPKIPVRIGELHFASKGDAEEHFQEMLYRHSVGSRVVAWSVEAHAQRLKTRLWP